MSESKHRDFLDYWDSRFDENEKILNSYPQLANFTFRECNRLWDHLHSDYADLLARHNALYEAVKKERMACEQIRDAIFNEDVSAWTKADDAYDAARAEVDRLLGEE